MVKNGLGEDIVVAKIQASPCDFDTSPTALSDLKAAGVSNGVILAMVKAHAPSKTTDRAAPPTLHAAAQPPAPSEAVASAPSNPNGYQISYVKSGRKSKYGLSSKPYDKISEYVQTKLVEALDVKGLKTAASLDGNCCRLSIELLEVTAHPAVFKKPGMDVSANLTVTEVSGKMIYSKGYRGESRTMMNTYGHLINHACEDMVANMSQDESLLRVLATGKL
ncbi:MAG TPA: hypothetical protein VGW33_13920 [Terriglobia bacterium]|nr:hypothetical protein [Terriglobia bacterium]